MQLLLTGIWFQIKIWQHFFLEKLPPPLHGGSAWTDQDQPIFMHSATLNALWGPSGFIANKQVDVVPHCVQSRMSSQQQIPAGVVCCNEWQNFRGWQWGGEKKNLWEVMSTLIWYHFMGGAHKVVSCDNKQDLEGKHGADGRRRSGTERH